MSLVYGLFDESFFVNFDVIDTINYLLFSHFYLMALTIEDFKEQLNKSIINADVVKIFDNLLTIAVEMEASDVHIESFEDYCRMRLRLDGELQELVQYPKSLHESIISKFKIESGQMRPDERRLPQDARVSTMTLTNKEIDLRASTLPTIWWEKLVMRIVDKSKKLLNWMILVLNDLIVILFFVSFLVQMVLSLLLGLLDQVKHRHYTQLSTISIR